MGHPPCRPERWAARRGSESAPSFRGVLVGRAATWREDLFAGAAAAPPQRARYPDRRARLGAAGGPVAAVRRPGARDLRWEATAAGASRYAPTVRRSAAAAG